jgi:hypothetical protein
LTFNVIHGVISQKIVLIFAFYIYKSTDVSEEHIASNFRVEEKAEEETSVKAGSKQAHAGFLLGLFFDPEDVGDMFLRNVG